MVEGMRLKTANLLVFIFLVFCGNNFAAVADKISEKSLKWHIKKSPHFIVYHESSWSPDSITIEIEKIYNMMKIDISMFSPWMMREKSKIYIYKSKESYLNGRFKPPKWSRGLALSGKKTIVVYDTGDIAKLRYVIVHELTHLYFEDFFSEKFKYPPPWLNEGVAVLMADKSCDEKAWHNTLKYTSSERYEKYPDFFYKKIGRLENSQQIGDWYLQSFGIVKYLFDSRKRLQFKNFCNLIRDGKNIQESLWKAYWIKSYEEFGEKWFKWIKAYNSNEKQTPEFSSSGFNFIPLKSSSPKFKKFETDY